MLHPHPGCSRTESRSLIVHHALPERANSLDLLVKRPLQEFHFTNKRFGLVVANARVWTETFHSLTIYHMAHLKFSIQFCYLDYHNNYYYYYFQGRYRTH